ncbi:MAG: HAD-IA family hydrolase [Patescibacteria group bacterium]|jgi:FMN phosphatase YigB (HAD superfamily)
MVTTILSDFSFVILFPKDPHYSGTLNGLYKDLLSSGKPFNFWDYYRLDKEILSLYHSLKSKFSVNMFTSGSIQNAPEVQKELSGIFDTILSAEELNIAKRDPQAYHTVATKLGKRPHEILFIDDQEENIKAAQSVGMSTLLFTDSKSLSEQIETTEGKLKGTS